MDTWDAVALMLFALAMVALARMMLGPWPKDQEKDPDQRALRAWARADRDAQEGEPRLLTSERLESWRMERKALETERSTR